MGLEDGNGTVTIKPHTDGEHMSDEVLVERHGAVQVITINRPEARNALNGAVAVGVRDAVDELDADAELRAGCSTPLDGGRCHIGPVSATVRAGSSPLRSDGGRGVPGYIWDLAL